MVACARLLIGTSVSAQELSGTSVTLSILLSAKVALLSVYDVGSKYTPTVTRIYDSGSKYTPTVTSIK